MSATVFITSVSERNCQKKQVYVCLKTTLLRVTKFCKRNNRYFYFFNDIFLFLVNFHLRLLIYPYFLFSLQYYLSNGFQKILIRFRDAVRAILRFEQNIAWLTYFHWHSLPRSKLIRISFPLANGELKKLSFCVGGLSPSPFTPTLPLAFLSSPQSLCLFLLRHLDFRLFFTFCTTSLPAWQAKCSCYLSMALKYCPSFKLILFQLPLT